MRRIRSVVRCLSVALLACALGIPALRAADPFAPVGTTPQPLPAAVPEVAEAAVRIADAPWLDRELTRFAAALGRDPKPMRRTLAEALYHCKSLDGIDTARPAVFLWRGGSSPLQAIIPILADHRRQFLDDFGVMGGSEAPLVRVGDRDGTVVYTQNHPDGLREYRLLVVDAVAYLARNVDECRKLAARAPALLPPVGAAPPVTLTCSGAWLRATDLLAWSWPARMPLRQWLPVTALVDAAQAAVLSQLDQLVLEIRGGAEGRARIAVRVTARPDSEFAAWIATQQNQGNRLQARVGGPETAVRLALHAVWQDKLELLARAVLPTLRQGGDGWTPAAEESWVQSFATAGRTADAVWAVEVPAPGREVQSLVVEQPRAEEQFQHLDRVATALTGAAGTATTVSGFAGARRALPAAAGRPALAQLLTATTHHVVLIDGWGVDGAEIQTRAEALARSLQQATLPPGDPGIAAIWCNLGRLVRLAPGVDPEIAIPDALVQGTLRTAGVNALQIDLATSLTDAAAALSHLPDEPSSRAR